MPDFHAAHSDEWIIFPFEISESITQLQKRWTLQGTSGEEQQERFLQLGFEQFLINKSQSLQA